VPATDQFSQRLEEAMKAQRRAQRAGRHKPANPASASGASAPADDFSKRLAAERSRTDPAASPVSESIDAASDGAAATESPTSDRSSPAGPIGTGDYVVRQGDCIASIAEKHGHFWERIWDDPANAELRRVRKDSRVLLPGDRVTIPEKQQKFEPGQTEMRHRFQLKGRPDSFSVRVLRDGEPRGNEPYELEVDGETYRGVTQANGFVIRSIQPDAQRARLVVGEGEDQQEFYFLLGGIDPIEEISGVQQRLRNLGYDCGEVDGKMGPITEGAIRAFQKKRGLNETGEPDAPTRERLKTDYGC
jgi:hypothetical protein